MATIYRKTDRAIIETETKAFQLTPRLHTALILVDGQKNNDTLWQLFSVNADIWLQ